MGMLIPQPRISFKESKNNGMEHIEQHHFVKKTETKAVNKYEPKEEPKFDQKESFSIGDNTFHYTEPEMPITASYDPNTFQMTGASTSYSFQSVEDAIQNGKDTDLVVMKVGDVRAMQERIRIMEKEIMKSYSNTSAKQKHNDMIMDMERKRIVMNEQIREHEMATDLRKMEIQKAMLNRNFKFK
jgi:hypothetical protein